MQKSTNEHRLLSAGAAKVEITGNGSGKIDDPLYAGIDPGLVNDPLYVKALIVKNEETMAVIVSLDAVAVAEIGSIGNSFLTNVRSRLREEIGVEPENTLFNASHGHGVICTDIEERTVQAAMEAFDQMVPVCVGAGRGYEDRITENRRVRLKNGGEADVRRAYPLPPDGEVAGVGPVDPQIGLLRFDRLDGRTLAVVYNFACHPILGVPGGGITADITGFASTLIEEHLGHDAIALFLQGCAGDINPGSYKSTDIPKDAEPLGNMLGLSAIRALREITPGETGELRVINKSIELPRADLAPFIESVRERQMELLCSLKGTPINLKNFLALQAKYSFDPDYPSADSHLYINEEMMGRNHLSRLDAENRRNLDLYRKNIYIMEELTRVRVNLDLLTMHQEGYLAKGKKGVDVEVMGLRIGDFALVTFPGELSVQIGLNIKKKSPHEKTFVAGVTNGYIYYTPTDDQLKNRGNAQEDSDCIVADGWQGMFEDTALEILKTLQETMDE